MLSRELLYFKYLGFEIQLKAEQRKSIINLLRGEDAGYRDSFYGLRNTANRQIKACPSRPRARGRIFLIVVLLFVHFKV